MREEMACAPDAALNFVEDQEQAGCIVGGRALMVNAVDNDAADFWRRRGFLLSKDDPLVLFRSIADIAASLTQA